ncbi:hypothetical protein GWL_26860 [Herbaspirillum sp. GW103]|nr:hypothetical protein GWL_26860 [Herbaspirillum sp. GW103]
MYRHVLFGLEKRCASNPSRWRSSRYWPGNALQIREWGRCRAACAAGPRHSGPCWLAVVTPFLAGQRSGADPFHQIQQALC